VGQGAASTYRLGLWWEKQSSPVRAAIWALGILAFVGLLLALLAFTRPTTTTTSSAAATPTESSSDSKMTFSYSAAVKPSPAYQGDVARSPNPIFRSVANIVDVQYTYDGPSGEVSVAAELSATSGWTWSVPLQGPTAIGAGSNTGTVSLELNALSALAAEGAKATGIAFGQLNVAVVPTVTASVPTVTASSGKYAPALRMSLTPTTLTLPDGEKSLEVAGTPGTTDTSGAAESPTVATSVDNTVSFLGVELSVSTARLLAVLLILLGTLGIVVLYRTTPQPEPLDEADQIRAQYRELVLEVDPMPTPSGTVVDVPSITELAKLAKQYSLLILNGTDGTGEVFVIQDEFLAYRYRPAEPADPSDLAGAAAGSGDQEPDGPLSIL
jgi:hypothetical protein